jgi:hypothetical protein
MVLVANSLCCLLTGALRLPMYDGETVHFTDTLIAMTREMVKEVCALCIHQGWEINIY